MIPTYPPPENTDWCARIWVGLLTDLHVLSIDQTLFIDHLYNILFLGCVICVAGQQ